MGDKYEEIRPLLVWATHLTSKLLMQMYMHCVGLGEAKIFPVDLPFINTLRVCLVHVKAWQTQHTFQPSLMHNSDWADRCCNLLSILISSLSNNPALTFEDFLSEADMAEDLRNLMQISRIPSFRYPNTAKKDDSAVIKLIRAEEVLEDSQENGKTRGYRKCSRCPLTAEIVNKSIQKQKAKIYRIHQQGVQQR